MLEILARESCQRVGKAGAGMRLYRGTITEDLGCLMARWRPTIVTSWLGRGGGGDEEGGWRGRERERDKPRGERERGEKSDGNAKGRRVRGMNP